MNENNQQQHTTTPTHSWGVITEVEGGFNGEPEKHASGLRTAARNVLDYWEVMAGGDAVMFDKMEALRQALSQPATDHDSFVAGYEAAQADAQVCQVPPHGWHCTRPAGHDGPCAAVANDDLEIVNKAMQRLAEPPAQQQGWKLVPIDANDTMIDAFENFIGRDISGFRQAYQAMLNAAPQPAQQQSPCDRPCGDIKCAVMCKHHEQPVQQQQEPVACRDELCACRGGPCVSCPDGENPDTKPAQQQEPVAWMPIEQMYPQAKAIDILMGDGSILCAVLPQFDGDLWWEGSGTGEKFIDPKYANVTHWRIHDERTSPPAQPQEPVERAKAIAECLAVLRPAVKGKFPQEQALEELAGYTSPPASKPLTDDEIWREYRFLWPFHPDEERKLASDILMFARAIEAAHGIKENT